MKRVLSLMRQAVQKYNMINEGDSIGVGVSGGKDSLVLLYALNRLRGFYPKKFSIKAISVDIGFENADYSGIRKFCNGENIEFHIEKTVIKQIVFDEMKEKNPCSMCANLRRGALCSAAVNLGCNTIALGHNRDDANETLLMNLFFNSRIYSFEPVTIYENTGLKLIRPLIFVSEGQTNACAVRYSLPVMPKVCPNDGVSQRESIKKLINTMSLHNPDVRTNIFSAICSTDYYKKHENTMENKFYEIYD